MTLEEVRKRIAEIKEISHDGEAAHSKEDDLYFDVLTAIAEGHPDAQELAREALKADEIPYHKWFA
jgi:hypothetical protein